MRITGLLLIVACVGAILAAVVRGDQISWFIAALVPGIVRNILYRVGKPRYQEDEDDAMKRHQGTVTNPATSPERVEGPNTVMVYYIFARHDARRDRIVV